MTTVTGVTWVALGFTDDVTTCEICGKPELKGTIRLVAVDSDGSDDGEIYAGTTCAARRSGRKATQLSAEARKADMDAYWAAMDVYNAWSARRINWEHNLELQHGVRWSAPAVLRAFRASDGYRDAYAQFLTQFPEVAEPQRPRKR